MRQIRRRWLAALVAGSLAAMLSAGCSDDKGTNENVEPPEIPPASTFVMDFTDFTPSTLGGAVARGTQGALVPSKANWNWAAGNVLVWNIIITVGLAVPVAAFIEAFNHEPVEETDGTWVWAYNVEVADVLYLAELHGKTSEDGIEWAMHVSRQGAFSDFVWYTGESNLPGTEGTWTVYNSPDDPDSLLGILWHRNPTQETGDIKYTNIVPGGAENGGYIHYGITDEVAFDAFYNIYNKGQANLTVIQWNRAAISGRVKDPLHFQDSDWHCWDGFRDDVGCE